ncbi:TetR/AcrR family transcriptional regulator [Actinokineospora globicatena]|uniref:TetR/AcrR family transcriptional regulator n=1 Tax=Actinokineospora globicatena TaxID=103729 RepID=UPI0020A5BB8F|nr:TetR/AcrR family transcriptional regulator [Actinokineospora globicatena]MCP2304429.1 transcriptional regulator, TetR family [Actinokineospora globicatena]GLW78205.1 TetR family transcriptional regulator [Actinokineospora globicatena]GLW85129.1 TetR family transcriptional regulator [Actinokineospora globicatena]
MAAVRTHRTQQERSEQTREALLDATIGCLVELGYARTTVQEVCARAGVSRGAQQHHFTTKAELMTAALEHLFARLTRQVSEAAADLPPGRARVTKGIDLLWEAYSGTLSTAAVELWVAARTDPELRERLRPVDRALGHATLQLYRDAAGADLPEAELETLLLLSVNLVRGLALDAMIGGGAQRRARLLEEWKATVLDRYTAVAG